MIPFLLVSMPLLFGLVVSLPWGRARSAARLGVVSTFLKGLLVFFPGYLAILIVRRIFGFSYDGFLLYLSLLLRDHLAPILAALGGFLLLQRTLDLSRSDEDIFCTVFAFLSGFFSLVNVTDVLREWGQWDAYVLFLLPTLRVALLILVSLSAGFFYRWEGRDGVLFCAAGAALALVAALASYLSLASRPGWAIALCVIPVLLAVGWFAMRFPRVVQT